MVVNFNLTAYNALS